MLMASTLTTSPSTSRTSATPICYQRFTKEVYSFWCSRLGPTTNCIPADSIQALFNDMHLYPSKAQVYEMIQCARVCGTRATSGGVVNQLTNLTPQQKYLTFGEFCVFADELRRHATSTYLQKNHQQQNNSQHDGRQKPINNNNANITNNRIQTKYEVFLGGSCNPTTWRADTAIPTLNSWGISYYNPQVPSWSPELIQIEHHAKQSADVLLFVLDSETRCLAGMVEVAQLHAAQRCLVVVAFAYKPRQLICNEAISPQEYLDLWYGQNTLLALLRQDETPVFTNLKSALQCTARILRESTNSNEDYTEEVHIGDKLNKLRDAFNAADRTKSGNLSLAEVCDAYHMVTRNTLSISDLKLIVRNHTDNDHQNTIDINDMRITFEQFCGIVTEFTQSSTTLLNGNSNGIDLDLHSSRDWASNQSLHSNNNTNYETIDNNGCITTLVNDYHRNNIKNSLGVSSIHLDNPTTLRDIYIGGSYSTQNQTWRESVAIPLLNQYGLTYYLSHLYEITDPLSGMPDGMSEADVDTMLENIKNHTNIEADMEMELKMLQNSKVLLFVITSNSRSIASMLLAAYCIGLKKYDIILCVQKLPEDNCKLGSEELTKYAIKDYNRSRAYLSDMAKREEIPVFECINEAVQCAIEHTLQR
ncbi:uncharacterized protein LOC123291437 [Chrysoperla carnea]|uniref:uncharacterized protein LOC123291437 n=1 Tax=Chrysoperla carnea TaxID=189513 RepID=UPI001D07AAA5|nr:uncharacterized protein LOC123291437 [Chrysoperla carnea]